MKKILCAVFSLLIVASAAFVSFAKPIESVTVPHDIHYYVHNDGTNERVTITCVLDDEIASLTSTPGEGISYASAYVQVDYRIDGGSWHCNADWDKDPAATPYVGTVAKGGATAVVDLFYLTNQTAVEDAGDLVKVSEDGKKTFDFENHTLEIRLRTALYYVSTASDVVSSDWTQVIKVERKQKKPELPVNFDAPQVSGLKVLYQTDTQMPYLSFEVKTPENVKQAQAMYQAYGPASFQLKCYVDYGEGWVETALSSTGGFLSNETKFVYLDSSVFSDEKQVKVKLQYLIYAADNTPLTSAESEVLKTVVPRWAEDEGVLPARCTTCGMCKPVFGVCLFVVLGIALAALVIVAIIVKMQLDKAAIRKAEAEAERQKKIEAEKAAYNAAKQAKKQKNKKK